MAKKPVEKQEYVSQYSFHSKSRYDDYLKANDEYFSKHPTTVAEEYKKQPKKPKRIAKWIVNVLVIASVVVFVVVGSTLSYTLVVGGGSYVATGEANVHNFSGLCVAPTLTEEKVDLSPYVSSKEQATYLYSVACRKMTDASYFTAYNRGMLYLKMGSSDNYIDIDAVTMKTQKEYFNIEYHIKNSVPILDSMIGSILESATDIVTTERKYASANGSCTYYQKVKNNSVDDNGIPSAVWEGTLGINDPSVVKKDMTVFNSTQNGVFLLANHTVKPATILDAEVTYDEENGYYTVSATLDHTSYETVENSVKDIRSGTGDNSATYNLIKLNFTVWDTGYMRTFSLVEKWAAKVVISLNFNLETNWECSYSSTDCNLNKYRDAKLMKDALGFK